MTELRDALLLSVLYLACAFLLAQILLGVSPLPDAPTLFDLQDLANSVFAGLGVTW